MTFDMVLQLSKGHIEGLPQWLPKISSLRGQNEDAAISLAMHRGWAKSQQNQV